MKKRRKKAEGRMEERKGEGARRRRGDKATKR